MFLLASKIGADLFNKTPVEPYHDNMSILHNCVNAIREATGKYDRRYHVVWYSSSEVFGSINKDDVILGGSDVKLNMNHARTLYSIVKLTGELLFRQMFLDNQIQALTILRLFNISGKHQRRGVVYNMIVSALTRGKIQFSCDTTRTITSVTAMLEQTFESVFNNLAGVVEKNVAEDGNSVLMEDLANTISKYLLTNNVVEHIDIVRDDPDEFLRYRHTGHVDTKRINKESLNNIIRDVLSGIRQ